MISTTILADDLKIGSMRSRKSRVTNIVHRPDGRVFVKVTTRGGGSTVEAFKPTDYVRVYVKADAEPCDCSPSPDQWTCSGPVDCLKANA